MYKRLQKTLKDILFHIFILLDLIWIFINISAPIAFVVLFISKLYYHILYIITGKEKCQEWHAYLFFPFSKNVWNIVKVDIR